MYARCEEQIPVNAMTRCAASRDDDLFSSQQIKSLKDSIDAMATDNTKAASCLPSDVACVYLSYKPE